MMDLLFKTIIGPIVVGVILRLIDKWLNKDKKRKKRPRAYVEVSLGSFLAYDIDLLCNTSVLCHKSLELSRNLKITFR